MDNCFTILCCFYHTSTSISHRIHVSPPSWTSAPPPTPSHSCRWLQSSDLSSLIHRANSHWLSFSHMVVCVFPFVPPSPSSPPLPFSNKSVLYVCISVAALQISSSVPSFYIPYICINISFLFFSFWLTSFCITGCRFIHLIRTDSHGFLFMTNILLYICTTASLSIYMLMDI